MMNSGKFDKFLAAMAVRVSTQFSRMILQHVKSSEKTREVFLASQGAGNCSEKENWMIPLVVGELRQTEKSKEQRASHVRIFWNHRENDQGKTSEVAVSNSLGWKMMKRIVLFCTWKHRSSFFQNNQKKRAISTKPMVRPQSRAERTMRLARRVEVGDVRMSEKELLNYLKWKMTWHDMTGDTSRSETRQVGSGRPWRRGFGGRRQGQELIVPVTKTGTNRRVGLCDLQCI